MGYKVVHQPKPWGSQIPIIGDDIAKIGQAYVLAGSPCSPEMEMWVYGWFQAIPTLLISLFKPQLIDINIKHRHGKPRKGKKFKFTPDIFFRDAIIEIPVPRWVCFRIYEMSQRIGWYFLVADATEDFAINWMTTAYKMNGCDTPNAPYLRGKEPASQLMIGSAGHVSSFGFSTYANSGMSSSPGQFTVITPGRYRINWTANFNSIGTTGAHALPTTTYLYDLSSNKPIDVGETGSNAGPGKYAGGGVVLDCDTGAGPFGFFAEFAQTGNCNFTCQISVDWVSGKEIGPDP